MDGLVEVIATNIKKISINSIWLFYLPLVDKHFDQTLMVDSKVDLNYIEDDEHRYIRTVHKHHSVIDMQQIQSNFE